MKVIDALKALRELPSQAEIADVKRFEKDGDLVRVVPEAAKPKRASRRRQLTEGESSDGEG